jgi:hypothetical protein
VARNEQGIVTRVAHVEVLLAGAIAGGTVEDVVEGTIEGAAEGAAEGATVEAITGVVVGAAAGAAAGTAAGTAAGASRSRGCGSSATMGSDSALLPEGEAMFGRLAADSVGELVDCELASGGVPVEVVWASFALLLV